MGDFRIISSDDHVVEPQDLWTSRLGPEYKDRAPHIVRTEDGSDWWFMNDRRLTTVTTGTQAGVRIDDPDRLTFDGVYEDIRPGGYVPDDRIKDMDIDGVDVSVIYTTVGLSLFSNVQDVDFLTDLWRAYNDWLAEFCSAYPRRLKGIALLNVDDLESCIKEMERCAKLGFIGGMISVYPAETRSYNSPEYEPLWAAAQDLDMPLSLHIGTNRPATGQEFGDLDQLTAAFQTNSDHWTRMSIAHMIFSGVFERYPKLMVGSIETELSWVPHFLDRLDYTYQQRARRDIWYRFKEAMLPSQYFHRNIFLSFQEDSLGIRLRDIIGVDKLQWGSDYPHHESTWPYSRMILDEILADCTEDEKAKIAGGNATRVYHLE